MGSCLHQDFRLPIGHLELMHHFNVMLWETLDLTNVCKCQNISLIIVKKTIVEIKMVEHILANTFESQHESTKRDNRKFWNYNWYNLIMFYNVAYDVNKYFPGDSLRIFTLLLWQNFRVFSHSLSLPIFFTLVTGN